MSHARFLLGSLLFAWACSGDSVGTPPPPTASLTGIVQEEGGGAPIAGATVTIGSATVNSGQDGTFQLQNVPIGDAIQVHVTAPGFDAFAQTLSIHAGANNVTLAMARITDWEAADVLVHIPREVATVRGVIVLLYDTMDGRPLARGDLAYYGHVGEYLPLFRARVEDFARAQGFVVLGGRFGPAFQDPATYDRILEALGTLAALASHPELAQAPLLPNGQALGGCMAYDLAVLHPDRVIGFISGHGLCHRLNGSPAVSVPGLFFLGPSDPPGNATSVFEESRALGARWALACAQASPTFAAQLDLQFHWYNAVLASRLPGATTGGPVTLRPIDEASGWLGNRTTFATAPYASYEGDKLKASWLPSAQSARDWHDVVSAGHDSGASRLRHTEGEAR